jgi:prepilin-type N-terminal cleavage/methylation domain-containing protein
MRPGTRWNHPMKTNAAILRSRNGFTLLELLLVLGILVALAGLSWPSVTGMLERIELQEAVEPVRANLAGTRIRALDAGVSWQFRFEPKGRNFLVVPYEFDQLEQDQQQQEQLAVLPRVAGSLPEGYEFAAASESVNGTERVTEESLEGLSSQKDLSGVNWSPPLLFYSDGSATDAAFDIVLTKTKRARRLTLRALTGAVTVSTDDEQVRPR